MAREDDKGEDKLEFTAVGETPGYISFDQAGVLTLQHARDNREIYSRPYGQRDLVWDVVRAAENEDLPFTQMYYQNVSPRERGGTARFSPTTRYMY